MAMLIRFSCNCCCWLCICTAHAHEIHNCCCQFSKRIHTHTIMFVHCSFCVCAHISVSNDCDVSWAVDDCQPKWKSERTNVWATERASDQNPKKARAKNYEKKNPTQHIDDRAKWWWAQTQHINHHYYKYTENAEKWILFLAEWSSNEMCAPLRCCTSTCFWSNVQIIMKNEEEKSRAEQRTQQDKFISSKMYTF